MSSTEKSVIRLFTGEEHADAIAGAGAQKTGQSKYNLKIGTEYGKIIKLSSYKDGCLPEEK